MTIQPVDVQRPVLAIEAKRRPVVGQGRPDVRIEFEDTRFGQCGEHGVRGGQELESATDGHGRVVIAFDAGGPDDQSPIRARNDVYGVAPMQQPQHVMEFDVRRMEAHNLTANAPEVRPVAPGAHATAIHDESGSRERLVGNDRVPMALDFGIFERESNRHQEFAIVQLRIAGKIQSVLESCPQGGFQFADSRTFDARDVRMRATQGKHPLDAKGLSRILAVPDQQGAVITIEDRPRQLRQPLWPECKAMPPHRENLWIGINRFRGWSDYPCCHPRG